MPPQRSKSGVGLKKALRRLVVNEVSMNGSGSHAAIHDSPNPIPHFKGAEEIQCNIFERILFTGALLRKATHHLLAQLRFLLPARDALIDHFLDRSSTLHHPCPFSGGQQCGGNAFVV